MSEAPDWMESLVDVVSGCMQSHNAMGQLGFRWLEEEGSFDIIVYPTPVELVGGAVDGAVVEPGFSLDVAGLVSAFEEVRETSWCAHAFGPHDPDGPHVAVVGVYDGHEVCLRILASAPEDEEPGTKVDVTP